MKFRKTLFFEIPSKDFIMPVYTEQDVNVLKSFLEEDEVLFSIGYKSSEDDAGYYYIGQVKEFTDPFCLKDFPVVYRKRIMDILSGLNENPQYVMFEENFQKISKIVYFKMTKNGPKPFIVDYREDFLEKLKRMDVIDYYIKDIDVFLATSRLGKQTFSEDEVFYRVKNPNY